MRNNRNNIKNTSAEEFSFATINQQKEMRGIFIIKWFIITGSTVCCWGRNIKIRFSSVRRRFATAGRDQISRRYAGGGRQPPGSRFRTFLARIPHGFRPCRIYTTRQGESKHGRRRLISAAEARERSLIKRVGCRQSENRISSLRINLFLQYSYFRWDDILNDFFEIWQ